MSPYNGKGKFIQRLAREFAKRDNIAILDSPNKCDINFRMNSLPSTNYGKSVIRLDNIAYSNETLHRRVMANGRVADAIINADAVIYQSELSKNNCEVCLGVAPMLSKTIPNGVDVSDFMSPNEIRDSGFTMLFACQILHPMRRVHQLIEWWDSWSTTSDNLIIAFDKDMCDIGRKTLPKNIKKRGAMGHDELIREIKRCHVIAFSTYMDSCPNLAIESLACGTPIVVNSCNGINEFVKEKNGAFKYDDALPVKSIVNWENPPEFDDVSLDQAVIEAEKCTTFVFPEQLRIQNVADEYIKLFEKVLQ